MTDQIKSKRLSETKDSNVDMKELLLVIQSMRKEIDDLKTQKAQEVNENFEISAGEYIKVMSLTPYTLNLTTEPKGKGKLFQFRKYGEVKNIIYNQLTSIIENHISFLEAGYFVILNDKVIRMHGLNDAYAKILTKENIDKVLVGNQSDAVTLFKNASKIQQRNLAMMFENKIINGEDVDLNFLDRVSRVLGYDIAEKADLTKETMEVARKANEKEE